jgi:hypothetical protein
VPDWEASAPLVAISVYFRDPEFTTLDDEKCPIVTTPVVVIL